MRNWNSASSRDRPLFEMIRSQEIPELARQACNSVVLIDAPYESSRASIFRHIGIAELQA